MKWLVTGGYGFVGSNLVPHLLERGFDVFVIDDLSSQNSQANYPRLTSTFPNLKSNFFNLADFSRLETCLRNFEPDFVAHLAAQTKMSNSLDDPLNDFRSNAVGTLNLLECLRRYSPKAHLFYASTNKVYGELDQIQFAEGPLRYSPEDYPLEFDETLPISFSSPYGCSKGAADQYVLDYCRVFGLKTTVFRHSSMFGANQYPVVDHGWLTWFCRQALEFQLKSDYPSISINGNGKQVRDILHVSDVCRLYILASEFSDRCVGNFYNIGGGLNRSLSILELFQLLNSLLNIEIPYFCLPDRISDQRYFVCDTSKVKLHLEWAPTINIKEGIISSLEWLKSAGSFSPKSSWKGG